MTDDPFKNYQEISVDENTKSSVFKNSKALMSPKIEKVAVRYTVLFVVSIFFSLMVCPQRGVGVFQGSSLLFHHLLHTSEILCGLYCGFMFYITTHVLSFFILSHFERLILIRKITYLPALFISLFFGLSMTSFFSGLDVSASYFLSWIGIVILGYLSLTLYYKSLYVNG